MFARTHDNSVQQMFLMNAIQAQTGFRFALQIIFTLHNTCAFYTPSVLPSLLNGSHIAMNHASLFIPKLTLKNQESLYQHTQHFSWQPDPQILQNTA
jgi:hypothetical protein